MKDGLGERAPGGELYIHLTGCGVGLGFSQKEGEEGEDEGWSRREGSGLGVIHTPYRVWGRAGVLTERRGRGRG